MVGLARHDGLQGRREVERVGKVKVTRERDQVEELEVPDFAGGTKPG